MRCFALVQLDGEAAALLASRARIGEEPTWVHRCHLEHGHGGDHRCVDATTECLLEWDDSLTPRVIPPPATARSATTARSAPAAGGRPLGDPGPHPTGGDVARIVNGAEHPAAPESVTALGNRTEVQALDAIAAALERICDAVNVLIGDPDEGAARRVRRHSESMDHDPGGRLR